MLDLDWLKSGFLPHYGYKLFGFVGPRNWVGALVWSYGSLLKPYYTLLLMAPLEMNKKSATEWYKKNSISRHCGCCYDLGRVPWRGQPVAVSFVWFINGKCIQLHIFSSSSAFFTSSNFQAHPHFYPRFNLKSKSFWSIF